MHALNLLRCRMQTVQHSQPSLAFCQPQRTCSHALTETELGEMQAVVKPALVDAREEMHRRSRALGEQALQLQERLDAASHLLTQRAEDQAALATQVPTLLSSASSL